MNVGIKKFTCKCVYFLSNIVYLFLYAVDTSVGALGIQSIRGPNVGYMELEPSGVLVVRTVGTEPAGVPGIGTVRIEPARVPGIGTVGIEPVGVPGIGTVGTEPARLSGIRTIGTEPAGVSGIGSDEARGVIGIYVYFFVYIIYGCDSLSDLHMYI
jgi:hypothetical protein